MLIRMLPPILTVHNMMPNIMLQVTTLAQSTQIIKPVICLVTVQVCRCKYDFASCYRMRFVVFGPALWICWRSFTTINAICQNCPASD